MNSQYHIKYYYVKHSEKNESLKTLLVVPIWAIILDFDF